MSRRGALRFPPRRLAAVPDRWSGWVRSIWFLALAFAVVFDIAATVFVYRDVYRSDPQFNRLTLSSQAESDGSVTVQTIDGLTGTPAVAPGSYITSIDGKPVARSTPVWELALMLKADDGQAVSLGFVAPDGTASTFRIEASDSYAAEVNAASPIARRSACPIA